MRLWILGLGALAVLLFISSGELPARELDGRPLPEFTEQRPAYWFNSSPLKKADLQGKVVLLDIWTFECWNCYRSFPWLKALEAKFADQAFTVIGIHTPEFDRERDPANVAAAIKKFGLHHPVMMDNDFNYWNKLGNRYWPTFYLIDKQGRLRSVHVGETHAGDSRAMAIEREVQNLLAERDS